jgi:RND family efflux transporter MFP subunit
MKIRFIAVALLAFAVGVGATVLYLNRTAGVAENAETENQLWTCGMHPQVIQDEPGLCPICNMKLTPIEGGAEPPAAEHQHEEQASLYTCPMHPQVMEKEPGQCPICNMDLVPVETESVETPPADTSGEASKPTVRVSQAFLQNFAVRTVQAEKGSIPLEIRTVGSLRFNEKDIVGVNTKYEGWIEKAYVNYVGETVEKGQLLFEVYSPPLVTAQKEYLAAAEYVGDISKGGRKEAVDRARRMLEAAEERLRWWDVTEAEIAALKASGKVTRTLKVFAPAAGTVIEKMGDSLEGMRLMPGMTVFKLAGLDTIWADVEVYEDQLRYVRLGQTARITADAFPGRRWVGKVIYIDPVMNARSRTLKASVEIINSGGRLRPDMFVNVDMSQPASSGVVTVPEEVVLHTGQRTLVVVQNEPGVFEPRAVHLGASGNGLQEIRHGLEAGETVVASSQFLIDSESSLREAINKMIAGGTGDSTPATAGHQH